MIEDPLQVGESTKFYFLWQGLNCGFLILRVVMSMVRLQFTRTHIPMNLCMVKAW
jgi:hypothetical protein